MKKTAKALMIAATLALPTAGAVTAQGADTISMGHAMLTGGLYNHLNRMGIPTEGVDKLTLNEIVQIQRVLDDSDPNAPGARQEIQTILDKAAAR